MSTPQHPGQPGVDSPPGDHDRQAQGLEAEGLGAEERDQDALEHGAQKRRRKQRASFGEEITGHAPPPDSDAWRALHKITPVLNIWQVLVLIFGVGLYNIFEFLQNVDEVDGFIEMARRMWVMLLGGFLGVLAVILLITWIYSYLAWKRMRYAVDERAVYFQRGILFKQQRMARLNRVQAVDIEQPLVARLVKLARVKVEVAGGADSVIAIEYLTLIEAERVRAEILARAAGIDVDARAEDPREILQEAIAQGEVSTDPAESGAGMSGGPEAAHGPGSPGHAAQRSLLQPEPKVMFTVPHGRLLGSVFLDIGMVIGVLAVISTLVFVFITGLGAVSIVAWGPGLLAIASVVVGRVSGEWNHRASVSTDGIKLKRGLFTKRSQTLPPGRIQAVRLRQGILWRRFGWWRVQVNVAGYGDAGDDTSGAGAVNQTQTVLLPVGRRQDALTALWLVLPDIGTEDPRPTIDAALEGTGTQAGFIASPERARWLDPLTYRHNGLLITRTAMIIRRGRFSRTVMVVPHERTQSLAIQQGPLERRMALTTMVSHSVPGPIDDISAVHLDNATAGEVLLQQARRARRARRIETPEEWQRRVGVHEESATTAGTTPEATAGATPEGTAGATPDRPGTAMTQGQG